MAKQKLLNKPQKSDPGSDGSAGYEFQCQVAVRKCIEMLAGNGVSAIVCEFHEDIIRVQRLGGLHLQQVKKKETGPWTLSDLLKHKKKTRSPLGKLLLQVENGRDVTSIEITSHGGFSSKEEEPDLPTLVSLLKTPSNERDSEWKAKYSIFENHLKAKLGTEGVSEGTVVSALTILDIDLSYPHPDAIAAENKVLLDKIITSDFEAALTTEELSDVYGDLCARVRKISNRPKQHWTVKSISLEEATTIVGARLLKIGPLKSREQIFTLQEKLDTANLGDKRISAIEFRMRALLLRKTLNISSSRWQKIKARIAAEWNGFRTSNPRASGGQLWQELLNLFEKLGNEFSQLDARLDFDFVQGVFFDMVAICDAKFSEAHD